MKTWEQLTPAQQERAEAMQLKRLLEDITGHGLRFNDALNGDNLQARIDAACAKAEEMQTPWFAHEYILDTCRDELEGMARAAAEDALYAEAEDAPVVYGIATA